MAISLEKIEKEAPKIFNLVKKVSISLEKKNLSNHRAKVALVLDISGSMNFLYSSGKVQEFAEKVLALGCCFDDNGALDIFLFGNNAHYGGEMTVDNFRDFIPNIQKKYPLEGGTYYGKVMKSVRNFYFPDGKGQERKKVFSSTIPVYAMFVTDGATGDELETENQLRWSSYEPIFWQFMAIGKSQKDVKRKGIFGRIVKAMTSDFSFLEKLDELSDRFVDNANFFSVEDPANITDEELYDLLTAEYPGWVKLWQ